MAVDRLIAIDCGDCIIVNDKELYRNSLKKFVVAIPWYPQFKGFCCQTILVSALDKDDARIKALRLSKSMYTGEVKEVNY